MTIILTAEDQEKIIKEYIKANYCSDTEEPVLQDLSGIYTTNWNIVDSERRYKNEAESESTKS